MIDNVLILVGGYGKRLGSITKKIPKPLIKFNNKPFLDILIDELIKIKPKKIILLCSYKKKFFLDRYKNNYKRIPIINIIEKKPLGTGGAVYNAKKYITNKTLICNGDTFIKFDKLKANHEFTKNSVIKFFITKNVNYKSNKKLSKLKLDKNKKIILSKSSIYMNSGTYIVNKKIIKFLKKNYNSLEDEILPNLINLKYVDGEFYKAPHFDIGTKKNIAIFKKYLKNRN